MPVPPPERRAPLPAGSVSAVLPTYDRHAALAVTFGAALAVRGVAEVLVVDDGSHRPVRAPVADPRVRVLRHERNRGAPAARNTGAAASRGEWLLFLEDDCCFPADYAEVLLAEATRLGADVVGAPMVHPRPGEAVAQAGERARAEGGGDGGLDGVARFPRRPLETPLLQAPSLVRRSLWQALGFDGGYRANAYREETDFFVRAARSGARCVLTPATCFWEIGRFGGGAPRTPVVSELWTWQNNARFLRRHGRWLLEQGLVDRPPVAEQAAFVGRRLQRLALRRDR